jgi:hypothetical protein
VALTYLAGKLTGALQVIVRELWQATTWQPPPDADPADLGPA